MPSIFRKKTKNSYSKHSYQKRILFDPILNILSHKPAMSLSGRQSTCESPINSNNPREQSYWPQLIWIRSPPQTKIRSGVPVRRA